MKMSVKELMVQKKQAEKVLAALNKQIVESIQSKLGEAVALLQAHQEVAAESDEIKRLVAEAIKAVYGDDATVGREHKAGKRAKGSEASSSFEWQRLVKALADASVTSAQKGLTKRELEELYFGDVGVRFEHNKWSDKKSKAEWLTQDHAAPKYRRYWVKTKRSKK